MGPVARAGMLAAVVGVTSAVAADMYALRAEHPETGSNIARLVSTWPVPVEARYEDLTPEQKRVVRADYVTLGPNDEPAYPRYGMASILREVAKVDTQLNPVTNKGVLHLAVRVDANGQPRGVGVLKTPDEKLARAISLALMQAEYKPATCSGRPCDSDYSFRYDFRYDKPRNFLVEWPPSFWTKRLKPD